MPAIGAKIVSIYDKAADHEWLLPPANCSLKPIAYGAAFVEQDMSGWDEMFPTITQCAYPVPGLYKGVRLPDHGEVWSLPWVIMDVQADSLTLAVIGQALPYRLTGVIRVLSDNVVRFEYQVVNTAQEMLALLWAAHPQFKVDAETRIILPPEVNAIVNVLDTSEWGSGPLLYRWPKTITAAGQPFDLDRVRSADHHAFRKFYLPPNQPVQWAMLVQPAAKHWIRLEWDAKQIPYLGLWIDEGGFNTESTVAFEPSTGFYDDLFRAWENKRVMSVPPNASFHWHVDVSVGTNTENINDPS